MAIQACPLLLVLQDLHCAGNGQRLCPAKKEWKSLHCTRMRLQCNFPAMMTPSVPHYRSISLPARQKSTRGRAPASQGGPSGFLSRRFGRCSRYTARASGWHRMSTCCSSAVKNQTQGLEGCAGTGLSCCPSPVLLRTSLCCSHTAPGVLPARPGWATGKDPAERSG